MAMNTGPTAKRKRSNEITSKAIDEARGQGSSPRMRSKRNERRIVKKLERKLNGTRSIRTRSD